MMVPRRALSIAVSVALLASCEAKTRSFSNAQGDAGDEDASPANGASDEGSELPPDDAGGTTSDTSSADTSSSSENDDETVDPNDGDASVDETSTATDDTSGDETTSESGADTSSESSDSDDTDTATSSDSTSSETAAGGSGGFGGQASGGVGGATNGGAEAGGTGNGGAGAGGNGGTTSGGASGSAGNGGGTSGSGGMGGAGVGGTNAGGGGVGGSGGHGGTGAGGSGGIGGAGGSGGTGDPECTLDEECPPPNNPCQETAVCNDGSCEVGPSPCGEMPAGCECVELGSSICGVAAVDEDGDSFGTTECVLLPGDDCDDTAPLVYPRAPELCDGIDNDCDDLPDLLDGTPLHGTNQTLVLSARQPRIDWSSTLETFGVSWAGAGFARFNTMSPLGALSVSPSTTFWQTVAAGGTFTNNAVAANTLGFGLLGVITEGVAGPVQQIPTFFHLASDGPQESTPLQGTQPCSLGLTTSGDRGWLYCGRASQGLAHAFLPLGNDAAPSNGPDLDSAYLAGATLMTGAPVGAIVGWDAIPVALPEPPAGWSMQQHFANFTSPSVKPTVSAAWPVAESYATVVGAVGSSSFATAWRYEGKASTWFGNRASQDVSCGPVTVAEDFIPLKMLPFGSNFLILGLETSAATPALAVVLVAADCEVLSLPLLVGPSGTADALSPDFAAGGQGVAVVWTENNNVRRRVFGLNLCDAPTP